MRHAWFFQDDELERWVSICIKCINHILWWYSVFRFQVLRQGGYLVAQPLDHSSLHSVLESRRNNFSENASVRMTSGPESSGLFLHLPPPLWNGFRTKSTICSIFSSVGTVSDSSPAGSCQVRGENDASSFCNTFSAKCAAACAPFEQWDGETLP